MNEQFEKFGAIYVPRLLSQHLCYFFTHVLLRKADLDPVSDQQVPSSLTVMHHEIMFETLQEAVWPMIENALGEPLMPTYSYSRLYHNGDTLEKHTDRPACEVSATIQLGRSHHYSWPIYMGGKRYDMAEGDAIIYKGCDIEHWRDACDGPEGYYSGQVFVHFVKKNGQHTSQVGDPVSERPYSYKYNRTKLMEEK